MKAIFDPPSGYVETLTDVRFRVEFPPSAQATVTFTNQISQKPVEVLLSTNGSVLGGEKVVVRDTHFAEGFLNLFQSKQDVRQLSHFASIDFVCKLERVEKAESTPTVETQTINFFNESMSLDGNVLPFDMAVEDPIIDVQSNQPLRLVISAQNEAKYQLAIMSVSEQYKFPFQIRTRQGKFSIEVPIAILFHELALPKSHGQRFQLFWLKHEGRSTSGLTTKRFIPIPNCQVEFIRPNLCLDPQVRLGPLGLPLGDNFVLSDRFFVPTFEEFTGFGAYKRISKRELIIASLLAPELIDMRDQQLAMLNQHRKEHGQQLIKPGVDHDGIRLIHYIPRSPAAQITEDFAVSAHAALYHGDEGETGPPRKKGCGCGRKKG